MIPFQLAACSPALATASCHWGPLAQRPESPGCAELRPAHDERLMLAFGSALA